MNVSRASPQSSLETVKNEQGKGDVKVKFIWL